MGWNASQLGTFVIQLSLLSYARLLGLWSSKRVTAAQQEDTA